MNTDKDIFQDAKLWDYPSVDDQLAQEDNATNALNRPRGKWKFEAPEEDQEVQPLTAQDIEAIRLSAYQEGLKGGHEEGFQKGYEEGLEKGQQAGMEEGKANGIEQGKAQGQTQIDETSARFESLISQLQAPLAFVQADAQKELVILAKSLSNAVIKVESKQNEQVLLQAIEEGIKALPIQESQYRILLHPDDLTWLTEHFTQSYIDDKNWLLVASESHAQGGCSIQTQNNAVDVSIENRCQQIFSQLLFDQGVADDPRSK